MSTQDKVVLITGACTRLGLQLAGAFGKTGARLALSVRDRLRIPPLQAELLSRGVDAFIVPCDTRVEEDVVRMVHQVAQQFGRVDVLINAAAETGVSARLVDYPSEAWGDVIGTHITGTYLVCREVLPWMTRQNAGSIINLTSDVGSEASPQAGAFLVSASGVDAMTRLLASELRGTGVRANAVIMSMPSATADEAGLPGMIDTCLWLASDASATTSGERLARRASAGD